eukprot:Pgem_evm1s15461
MLKIVNTVFCLRKVNLTIIYTKHKLFNDDGIEEKIRRGVFPLSYNETKTRFTPIGSIRVIKERLNNKEKFSVPRFIPVNHDVRPEDVVAMDPGVRTFMTFRSEWGVDDMKR